MKPAGGNKYRAQRQECRHGHVHASKREARRCDELHLLLRAGEIEDLEQQPRFYFEIDGKPVKHERGRRVAYTADFRFVDRQSASTIVEEVKGGYRDDTWRLRRAFFRACFPDVVLREV